MFIENYCAAGYAARRRVDGFGINRVRQDTFLGYDGENNRH